MAADAVTPPPAAHAMGSRMAIPSFFPGQSTDDFEQLAEQARKASDLLKALSHEHRLLILCLLVEQERSVSELEDIMRMSQATVSQQLARLRGDRLVTARRDGRVVYYSIASSEVSGVISSLYDIFCARVRNQQRALEEI